MRDLSIIRSRLSLFLAVPLSKLIRRHRRGTSHSKSRYNSRKWISNINFVHEPGMIGVFAQITSIFAAVGRYEEECLSYSLTVWNKNQQR